MAATATELRRIYINLFHGPMDPGRLQSLRRALRPIDRGVPTSRAEADLVLAELNAGEDPQLTFTQLECLQTVLSAEAFLPLVPGDTDEGFAPRTSHLARFYKSLFAEPDLAHLRALQRAVFDYDKFGTDTKKRAVMNLLRDVDPEGPWTDAHVGALEELLVRDITFKHVAPFQVTGDFW